MKLKKCLILFVITLAICGLYSNPAAQQQQINNPTYYDPAEHVLNKVNNAFLSSYGLPPDCVKWNTIAFTPAQAKLSAPSDSLSMKVIADSLFARWQTIAKQCGYDYVFQEGKVHYEVEGNSTYYFYRVVYQQQLSFSFAYDYDAYSKPRLEISYSMRTASYTLVNSAFDSPPKPAKIITPQTAISCFQYVHSKGFPTFKELHKEYLNFADLDPFAEYRSADGVYLLKFKIAPYGIRGLGVDYYLAGFRYVWSIFSLSTNEHLAEIDAISGREGFYASGNYASEYYYPFDRNAEGSFRRSSDDDYANALQAFGSMRNVSSFGCVFIGPLIRHLEVNITPYQMVSKDMKEMLAETVAKSLEQFLSVYGFPGQIVSYPEEQEYDNEYESENWSKSLGVSYKGFRLYHPLSRISVSWQSYEDVHFLMVKADYVYLPAITLPNQVVSPETIYKITTKDEVEQRFDYEWVDLATLDGTTDYFPAEKNIPDREIVDDEDDEDSGGWEYSPSSITLILYDDDTDDELNYTLCYWFRESYHEYIYEAATGRLVEERGELY